MRKLFVYMPDYIFFPHDLVKKWACETSNMFICPFIYVNQYMSPPNQFVKEGFAGEDLALCGSAQVNRISAG